MKNAKKYKTIKRLKRERKVRAKLLGTAKRPRLSVFRSLKHIYGQLFDDTKGITLLSSSSLELKKSKLKGKELAHEVGKSLAKKAELKKIKEVVFDRGGYKFHGQVKAVADGAKEGGLKF